MDCIGLLALSFVACGSTFEDERGYGREPWDDRLRSGLVRRFGYSLHASHAQPGDIALIRWGAAEPSHVGIVGDHPDGGLTLIHVHTLLGWAEQSLSGGISEAVIEVYRPTWGIQA